MRMLRVLIVCLVAPCVAGLLAGAGCPTAADSDAPPAAFGSADLVRGGALYDKFWAVTRESEPTGDHPLWSARPDPESNVRTGADTWRCKECHGWDYKGVSGAYASGGHRTGVPGIFGTTLSAQAVFDLLRGDAGTTTDGHGYGAAGLADADLWDLTRFVLEGQIDTDDLIDGNGAFAAGDVTRGGNLFTNGIGSNVGCATCHGLNGLTPPPGSDPATFDAFPGAHANENPWEFQHKVRFGQPGTSMPAATRVNAALQDVADVGAFVQTLPQAP